MEQLTQLSTLSGQCRQLGIEFGIGLTPYEIHLDPSAQARADLQRKVAQLDEVGIDLLCLLFDDMRGGPQLAEMQARVVNDVTEWSKAQAFIVCPTYYSDDPVLEKVFGPAPLNYLRTLGRSVDPAIDIFWTGEKVCSSRYPDAHLADIADRLRRKPFIWENQVANDGKERSTHLYLEPFDDGRPLHCQLVAGISINPMNQPSLSRVPLAAYAAVLRNGNVPETHADFRTILASICGATLATEVLSDLDLFQRRGLAAIDGATRRNLIEKYRCFEPSQFACEIGAWLRGHYDFDPNCLTE